jgi:hypothetical protein
MTDQSTLREAPGSRRSDIGDIGDIGDQWPWSRHRAARTVFGMSEPQELEYNEHWRIAVWALRVGYIALAVALVSLIVTSSRWILAIGVIVWLATAAVTLTGFLWARRELPEPRPGYWSMRFMLIHDTVHARSSVQQP